LLLAFGIAALKFNRQDATAQRKKFGIWNFVSLEFIPLALIPILSIIVLSDYWYDRVYAKAPDWRGLAAVINRERRDGDVIVQNFPETSLVYYDRSQLPLVVYPQTFLPDASTPRELDKLNARYQRVWFIPAAADYWDPEQFVEGWLNRHDDLQSETRVATFRLKLYSTPAQFLGAMQRGGATFGDFARLEGVRVARADTGWRVVLYWRALATTKRNLRVSLQLGAHASAQTFAQVEHPPVNGTYATNQWRKDELIVDAYELPFDARADLLRVAMVAPNNAAPLPVSDASGNPSGGTLEIPLTP
jgi:hypothetical protein